MPVTLNRKPSYDEQTVKALRRITQANISATELDELISDCKKPDADQQLVLAVFNERNVGCAFLKGPEIKALVVHPATRNRGVGERFLTLLAEQINGLYCAEGLDCRFINKVLKPIQP